MSTSRTNITLSADADLVRRAREYAAAHNTTLNQIVRQHMEQITGRLLRDAAAREFEHLARTGAGRTPKGYRFDRDAVHAREG